LSDPADPDDSRKQKEEQSRSPAESTENPVVQLVAEDLSVAKETRETGRVRISTHTREREVLIDENLARERVEIETVPVGRKIDAMPEVRQEGDATIVPVVEEVLVVERQLMLKEEIHIKRVRSTERHQEKVALRHQEAVVTRYQPDSSKADPKSTG
jgi:stress response protein YsnF